jgi:PGF-pre-PGF domain-containing protein
MTKITTKNKSLLLITFIILLILASSVFALTENLQIKAEETITLNECVVSQSQITLINTGDIESVYTLSKQGSLSRFVSLTPKEINLKPGQSQNILITYAIPCGKKGKQTLEIKASTKFNLEKEFKQKVIVQKIQNIELLPINYSQVIKPCKTALYQFNLKNIGPFQETYTLTFEQPFGKYISLNFNQITLAPNQEAPIYMYLTPSCEIYGNYTIPFSIKTTYTKLQAKTFIYLLVNRAYDYDLKQGYPYNQNKEFIENDVGSIYSLCSNSRETIPVEITNNADLINNYDIEINAPEWATISKYNIELNQTQKEIVELNLNTFKQSGEFNIILTTLSKLGEIRKTKNLTLNIENCYEPELSTIENKKKVLLDFNPTTKQLNIKNKGTKSATYIPTITNLDWLTFEPSSVIVPLGETKTINLISDPSDEKRGKYKANIDINIDQTNTIYTTQFKITLVTMNFLDKFYYKFLIPYWVYIILAIILITLLTFIIIKLIQKQKTKPKKIKQEKKQTTTESKKQTKTNKKLEFKFNKKTLLISALIILAIIIISSLFFLFSKLSSKDTPINETINKTIENINETIEPIINQTQSTFTSKIISPIKTVFQNYWLYILIGLIILLVLIALIILIKKAKQNGLITKLRQKLADKQVQKTKNPFKIKITKKALKIILVLIVIILIGYFIYLLIDKFQFPGVTGTIENITTNITKTTNTTKQPSVISSHLLSAGKILWKYVYYILYFIAAIVILLFIILLFKKAKQKRTTLVKIDSAEKQILIRSKKLSCGEIIIKLNRTIYHASLLLKKVRKPTFIKAGDEVYEYFNFEKDNLDNVDIKETILRFKVKKSWLKRKKIKKNDVSLRRYNNNWQGINTTLISEDKKYFYYESILNHLSFFAITGKRTEPVKKETKEIKPKTIKIKKTTEKKIKFKRFNKEKLLKFLWIIITILIILILAAVGYYFWINIVNFISFYQWYILGSILLLVLIALIFLIVLSIKKRPKQEKKSKNTHKQIIKSTSKKAKFQRTKSFFQKIKKFFSKHSKNIKKIIIAIIILILIILLIYSAFIYLSSILPLQTANITTIDPIEEDKPLQDQETEQIEEDDYYIGDLEVIGEEPGVIIEDQQGIPDQEWDEDMEHTINLSKYFFDPDRDNLYYTHTELENIFIYYEENQAILVPKPNWHGSEFVIFTADDRKGGKIESNLVKLNIVNIPEESVFITIWEWVSK